MKYSKEEITAFFRSLDRGRYMDDYKDAANMDRPFPIGHGQTISQPSLVLNMTLHLDLENDSKVLEIGTGSGFQTALLAKFSKNVYTVERIETLHNKARERLDKEGYTNIHFHLGDGSQGWEENAPYDRIMVTAAAEKLPETLISQLAPEGKMIIPVGGTFSQELRLLEKDRDGNIQTTLLEHVRFVRLGKDTD
ncbi:protein-L-isoaspartate(D-aspartate) O-methyltransferase [Salinicoccus halodurans]|uniref:Protein-L-isoaspartate O-methyltransferase n=2 Tax=Salinicoccus halodurans TaxID=407035 RepID=A0AA94KVH8_9STAP|nr:protein-L-isoaspartate(D-aspartate) O-methyltransferase [Salinicoccus halodurans]SFK65800.1 protein-L-isoaspartate(D-aspartate) O-methyltransferase [Salinicoccus halodurans]